MSNRKTVVLVVEDNPLIRMGAVDLMTSAGFEPLEASDADEAIRILESRPDIHLVFTDVGMPGTMDGIKLSHCIRDRWPPVKLIVTSGKMTVDENHLPVGAKLFPKPYNESSIVEAMRGMLPKAKWQHPPTSEIGLGAFTTVHRSGVFA
jgi:two-component system, response regulator PdtaR